MANELLVREGVVPEKEGAPKPVKTTKKKSSKKV